VKKLPGEQISDFYSKKVEEYTFLLEKEKRRIFVLSLLRLVVFTGALAATFLGFRYSSTVGWMMLGLFTALFLGLLYLWSLATAACELYNNLLQININELRNINGEWSHFDKGSGFTDQHHRFSFDADIFGDASLYQYLCRTVTGYGSEVLASWLASPSTGISEIRSRQSAVAGLALKPEWRQKYSALGMQSNIERPAMASASAWFASLPEKSSPFTSVLLIILPALSMVLLILAATGLFPFTAALTVLLINLLVTAINLKQTNRVHNTLTGRYKIIASMAKMLSSIVDEEFKAARLSSMKMSLCEGRQTAPAELRSLGKILEAFDSRMNIIAGFLLNALILWDLQCINRLNNWKRRNGEKIPQWLGVLGEFDAFSSLANFSFNNPDFPFPLISDCGSTFRAEKLGHPLISSGKRVCNDFSITKGKICIISGANMAGKSTFLRTVAVNYILAMAGAPVCAGAMEFMPVRLFTGMRSSDSLSAGESYFYAELKRLGELVAAISLMLMSSLYSTRYSAGQTLTTRAAGRNSF
jgi:MutS domain V/MutS domain III